MATPRIFISSTCYDLQEIRFQLRHFINDFGYESVMSEFDDIFYSYELHAQESCLKEIEKCQLFVLVIGNNYGSLFHKEKTDNPTPDSVTLKEFRKALETEIFKHIFINKFVDYDYKNYKRALEKVLLKRFKETNIEDDQIESTKQIVKKEFDGNYPFPFDSYRYVFYFLDIIHELKEGNAYNTFESFGDIKDSLKKQWAGFMYENLSNKSKLIENSLRPIEEKIAHIDSNIKKLLDSKTSSNGNKVSFDITKLSHDLNVENLEEMQSKIEQLLATIFCYESTDRSSGEMYYYKKVWFSKKFDTETTKRWLEYLKELVRNYKWSKFLSVRDIFKGFYLDKYLKNYNEVTYKAIFELCSLYSSFDEDDRMIFVNTLSQKFNDAYEYPKAEDFDDVPF